VSVVCSAESDSHLFLTGVGLLKGFLYPGYIRAECGYNALKADYIRNGRAGDYNNIDYVKECYLHVVNNF